MHRPDTIWQIMHYIVIVMASEIIKNTLIKLKLIYVNSNKAFKNYCNICEYT
jgi:hypothetical protein